MNAGRRSDIIALAVLAAIITLLFADVLLGINALYARDVAHYYYPAKHVLRSIVLGGEFPYWNPYFAAGQPLAANPEHEVFYPLTWLILLPNYRVGFHLLTLVHLYIGAFTMYALLRSMRVRVETAFFGALAFGIGGIALSNLNLQPILFAVVWMPLTCLYTRRFLMNRAWRDFALAAFFFGVEVWVGEPSTILQTGLLLGAYAIWRGVRERTVRPLLRVALIAVVAAAAGAVQLLPAVDHASDSVRAGGLPLSETTLWSMPPIRLAELFFPNVMGHMDVRGQPLYWAANLYPKRWSPFYYSIYSGLLIVVLAFAGLFARVRGWPLALAISAFGAVFAFGMHTPLWGLCHHLGILRSLRFPEKFVLLILFSVIVFGSRALDELFEGNERVRKAALAIAGIVTGVAVLAAVFARMPAYADVFASVWQLRSSRLPEMVASSALGWLLASGRGVVVFVLIRNATRRLAWISLATAFALLDFGMILFEVVPRMPASFYDEPPALARHLPPDRGQWRLFHHADWHTLRAQVQPFYKPHPDIFWVTRNSLAPMMPARYGVRMALDQDFDRTALTPTADFVRSAAELSYYRRDWVGVIAAMSNVWYRAVFRDPEQAFAEARGDRRVLQPVGILALEKAPRYFFADRVQTIADRADFVRKLGSRQFGKGTAFVRGASFVPASGRVLHAVETTNTARIDVETAGRAFLVISVTPHKYWQLHIDGRPAQAIVTNVGYQGVVVSEAGRHVVEMRYRNPLIPIGGAITIVTLLALLMLARRT